MDQIAQQTPIQISAPEVVKPNKTKRFNRNINSAKLFSDIVSKLTISYVTEFIDVLIHLQTLFLLSKKVLK